MELCTFGFNGHAQLELPFQNEDSKYTPKPDFSGRFNDLQILWASWCDATSNLPQPSLLCHSPSKFLVVVWQDLIKHPCKIHYTGSGLTTTQTAYFKKLENQHEKYSQFQFFGAPLSVGLNGILDTSQSTITIFKPDSDIFTTYRPPDNIRIHHIALTSGGTVALVAAHPRYSGTSIASFSSITALQSWLVQNSSAPSPSVLQTFPAMTFKQLVSNATTTTGLTTTGQVYTWTHDSRYPKLLGRPVDPDTPASIPHRIEYFSETIITDIASGGYLTAAISSDGELYLWGQSCPGTVGSLAIFQKSVDDDADEFVKCVELSIGGREAQITRVAVGSGHVIVAAETKKGERAVFAAGQGGCGQLGLSGTPEFLEEFTELKGLRKRKVVEIRASGWSTWVVVKCEK